MAAEPRQIASAEIWTRWEDQVVNGTFPLRRLLGCSDHSAVFLTEYKAKKLPDAAIKLMRTDGVRAKAQLKHWKAAAALSHPNLVRLFETGRCRLGGREFVFVVMEYAEQTLDQILNRRALSPDEVREMLPPTLGALAYLHGNQLVHGQLRPSNFLAIGDQLKLASDNIRPAGHPSNDGIVRISWYDPPELSDCGATTAADVWGLGVTLVEALTLNTPIWPDQLAATVTLPANMPVPFVGLVRRCLSRNPASRPSVIELEAPYKAAARANSIADPEPVADPILHEITPPRSHRKRNLSLAVTAALLISLAVWMRFSETSQAVPQSAVVSAPPPVAAPVIPKSPEAISGPSGPVDPAPAEPPVAPEAAPNAAVLFEAQPNVPPDVIEKIQSPTYVSLRVLVDPSGNVLGALMENPGRSKYLARLADEAARDWKFVETEQQSARVWLLRFKFTGEGVTATATEQ